MTARQRMLSRLEQAAETSTLASKRPSMSPPLRRVDIPKEFSQDHVPVNQRRSESFRCAFLGLELLLQPVEELDEAAIDIVEKFLAVFVEREFGDILTRSEDLAVIRLVSLGVPGPNVDTSCAGPGMSLLAGPVFFVEQLQDVVQEANVLGENLQGGSCFNSPS